VPVAASQLLGGELDSLISLLLIAHLERRGVIHITLLASAVITAQATRAATIIRITYRTIDNNCPLHHPPVCSHRAYHISACCRVRWMQHDLT